MSYNLGENLIFWVQVLYSEWKSCILGASLVFWVQVLYFGCRAQQVHGYSLQSSPPWGNCEPAWFPGLRIYGERLAISTTRYTIVLFQVAGLVPSILRGKIPNTKFAVFWLIWEISARESVQMTRTDVAHLFCKKYFFWKCFVPMSPDAQNSYK